VEKGRSFQQSEGRKGKASPLIRAYLPTSAFDILAAIGECFGALQGLFWTRAVIGGGFDVRMGSLGLLGSGLSFGVSAC
jgi:hypothetical protein